jgi:ABC-type glycerol-3-phosphate transport system permease component
MQAVAVRQRHGFRAGGGADLAVEVAPDEIRASAIQVLGFRLSKLVRGLFLIGIIVPVQIALVPLFIDYSAANLLDTCQSMIIPLAGFSLPMSVYLFSSFFEYIPRETYEAAFLDGAGPYRIFGLITLPLSLNTVVTVLLVFLVLSKAMIRGLESGATKR